MKLFGCAYYPEAWPRQRWPKDISLMKKAGINAVRLGEFNWSQFEPNEGIFHFSDYEMIIDQLYKNGISTLLCTPTASPPKWMSSNYPDILKMDEFGRRVSDGNRRHYCPSSMKFREFSRRITLKMAEAFKDFPNVFGWQLDNEISAEAESGFCVCPECAKRFRDYLRNKYQTIEKLNEAWNGAFWSGRFTTFNEIQAPFKRTNWKAEYAQFMSSLYTALAYEQRDILKRVNPAWKITTNSWTSFIPDIAPDEIFHGLDYTSCDTYINNDVIEFTHSVWDYYRNLKGTPLPFSVAETGAWNHVTVHENAMKALRAWVWDAFAHGAENFFYFRWRQSVMGEENHPAILPWSGNPGEAYRAIAKTTNEIMTFSKGHPDLPLPENDVAIVTDRLTGYITKYRDDGDYTYFHSIVRANQALNRCGVVADILPVSTLAEATLKKYKLVVLPQMEHVPDKVAEQLKSFVKNGGKLFAQCRLNRMDEYGKFRQESFPVNLKRLFGLHIDESSEIRKEADFGPFEYNQRSPVSDNLLLAADFLGRKINLISHMEKIIPDQCRILETYSDGCYKNIPLFTEHNGAWYLAAPLDEAGMILAFERILNDAGIEYVPIPAKCMRIKRGDIVFYINNSPQRRNVGGHEIEGYGIFTKNARL